MCGVYLVMAILLEVGGTLSLKQSEGFTRLLPSLLIVPLYVFSFGIFSLALKGISVSVAYAIWAGAGTALIALIGIFWFKEPADTAKMVSLALIVLGVIGLNLSGTGD